MRRAYLIEVHHGPLHLFFISSSFSSLAISPFYLGFAQSCLWICYRLLKISCNSSHLPTTFHITSRVFQMSSRRSTRAVATAKIEPPADRLPTRTTRPRRTNSDSHPASTAKLSRGPPTASPSIRLTVKTSSSKLRAATSTTQTNRSHNSNPTSSPSASAKPARNVVRKSYALPSESEDEDEDSEMPDAELGDEEEEDEEMDAEGEEDEDADGDVDMDATPIPPPVIKIQKAPGKAKQVITVKSAIKGKLPTVEQKEAAAGSDDDDEELSDLDSELGVEEEEGMQTGNEEDAEGEDEEIEVDEGDEDDSLGSDGETPAGGSRASTPDLNKLTKRQRARFEDDDGALLALPDGLSSFPHPFLSPLP